MNGPVEVGKCYLDEWCAEFVGKLSRVAGVSFAGGGVAFTMNLRTVTTPNATVNPGEIGRLSRQESAAEFNSLHYIGSRRLFAVEAHATTRPLS
jgi:hypothetical protein